MPGTADFIVMFSQMLAERASIHLHVAGHSMSDDAPGTAFTAIEP
jgi:hypothetical protein